MQGPPPALPARREAGGAEGELVGGVAQDARELEGRPRAAGLCRDGEIGEVEGVAVADRGAAVPALRGRDRRERAVAAGQDEDRGDALAVEQDAPGVPLGLAASYEKVGRTSDAVREYELFLQLQPNSADTARVRERLTRLAKGRS